jgi:hypothetical protein
MQPDKTHVKALNLFQFRASKPLGIRYLHENRHVYWAVKYKQYLHEARAAGLQLCLRWATIFSVSAQ